MYRDSQWFRGSSRCVAAAFAVGLSACGGGGGDGAGITVTKFSTPPGTEISGLGAPSVALTVQEIAPPGPNGQVGGMIGDLVNAYGRASAGLAARVLGAAAGGPLSVGTTSCSGGGTIDVVAGSPTMYKFNLCAHQGYTFDGPAEVETNAGTVTMTYTNIQVTDGFAGSLNGQTDCKMDANTWKCTSINRVPNASGNDFTWGWNTQIVGTKASGTHSCGCDPLTWNVTFYDFDSTSGRAIIQGKDNTIAWIERKSADTYQVLLSLNGADQVFDVTPPR